MGFASVLEDLIDRQDELDHYRGQTDARQSAQRGVRVSQGENRYENALFDDALAAESFYRSKLKQITRFVEYYRQDTQQLDQARQELPKHVKAVGLINKTLEQVALIEDWNDEAKWNVVQGIEKQLNEIIRDGGLNDTLSPRTLDNLMASAKNILKNASRVSDDLGTFLKEPIDSRVSRDVRESIEAFSTFITTALPMFRQDCAHLADIIRNLGDVHRKWRVFNELFTSLPLKLQRRLTIKELGRMNLHEEQEQFVMLDHEGCFQLGGVSGSGKSIILVYRALRLAKENTDRNHFVLTINRSLATQLKGTLEVVNRAPLPSNLDVLSVYDLFLRCIALCLPQGQFRLFDERSGERINPSWEEFVSHKGKTALQNVFADESVAALTKSLCDRLGDVAAGTAYLRDEVECVQSAYLKKDRNLYFEEKRTGRSLSLAQSRKEAVLKVVEAWEEWLAAGDLCDIHSVSLVAAELLSQADTRNQIKARIQADSILVDESQDLSTVELIGLRNILSDPDGKNALFLTGDVCQKVYSKIQAVERAGYAETNSVNVLKRNFRNTQEILKAAFPATATYPPPQSVVSGSITKPELSPYTGSKPLAVDCSRISHEEYINEVLRIIANERVAVVTENSDLLESLLIKLEANPLFKCVHVQSNADIDRWKAIPASPTEIAIFLSSFDAVKGFEFETVIVADASESRTAGKTGTSYHGFPVSGTPDEDIWRSASRYYAACTRARNHLIVTYVEKPSVFLSLSKNHFEWIKGEDKQLLYAITGNPR